MPRHDQLSDADWFTVHAYRRTRLRVPFKDESALEFRRMGSHHTSRERVMVYRHPLTLAEHRDYQTGEDLLRIPFLLHPEEFKDNYDRVCVPLLAELLKLQERSIA